MKDNFLPADRTFTGDSVLSSVTHRQLFRLGDFDVLFSPRKDDSIQHKSALAVLSAHYIPLANLDDAHLLIGFLHKSKKVRHEQGFV